MRSLRFSVLVFLAIGSAALAAAPVHAKGKPLASGVLASPGGDATAICYVTNVGSRPVQIFQVSIHGLVAVDTNTCTNEALAPSATCSFSGAATLFGGGLALTANTKSLRGHCQIVLGTTVVDSSAMR
jgi:hypothetical protein